MTEPVDYAAEVHDKAFDLVSADDTLKTYFTQFRRSPMLAIQPKSLPNLSIYLLRNAMVPDGDANAGQPSFVHNVHLGFSGGIIADDEDTHLLKLRAVMGRIGTVLLTNTGFIKLIEGVVSMDMKYVFSRMGETPLSEYQLEMVVSFRTDWPPDVPYYLEGITVTGHPFPSAGYANPIIRKMLQDSGG